MAESINPKEDDDGETPVSVRGLETALTNASASRKVKRKVAKKEKRKQIRKELAEKARAEEEARLNDPEEQRRIQSEEEREKERLERERREFEEREKLFLEELARKQAEEEEAEESRKALEEELKRNHGCEDNELNEDDEWEYVEEGPPEVIWQGNEIIVKKNRVKVKKKDANQLIEIEDPNRPTSNPLPPQSEAYTAYKDASKPSAQQLLENVAQQVSNFGTEQDKAHCPFHIKTGACRFGSRCNRAHFYPDKSCTLLIKNMYTGPGLAWEQDEGLESYSKLHSGGSQFWPFFMSETKKPLQIHTDEEIDNCYEEFYEDVHTEFLKFGEIVNFKVCRNGSFHLRGNVYIHYKSLDSAVLAYHAVNGRYFAGKQVTCVFVSATKWKVAICGEYMKSRLKTCSRGTACNFLHCFGNPGGDYGWADWDRPPPRYWVKKMTALFGYSDEPLYEKNQQKEQESPRERCNSIRISLADKDRYHSTRSRSRERDSNGRRYARSPYHNHDEKYQKKHTHDGRKRLKSVDGKYHQEREYESPQHDKNLSPKSDSDRSRSGRVDRNHNGSKKKSNHAKEALAFSDDYGEPRHTKLEEERVRKRSHSSRRVRSGLEASKVSSSEEHHIKSSGHLETGNISRSRSRTKSSYIDTRNVYDEDVEEMGHRESDKNLSPESDSDRSRSGRVDRNHNGSKKKSNHVKEALAFSDDYGEPRHPKLEEERVRKRSHSSRRVRSGLEASKVSSSEEHHIKSSGLLETGNFSRSRSRTKSSYIDTRNVYDEDVEEMGHRESDNDHLPDKHKKSKRKLTIEHYPNEDEERWKPDESSPKKDSHKSRRLVDNDRAGGRSRRSRWSSRERDVRVA